MTFETEAARFLLERRALGYSTSYLRTAARSLRRLAETLEGKPLTTITPRDLVRGLESEEARRLSAGTLAGVVVAYRTFFAHLTGRGILLLDPARGLPSSPPPRTLGHIPTHREIRHLLATAAEDLFMRVVLELLYGSGMRISEVRGLDVEDVDLSALTLVVRQGKGRKDRVVPITRAAEKAMTRYLATTRPATNARALLVLPDGTRPCYETYRRRFKLLVRKAGIQGRLTPHRLRHACAVHLVQNGASVRLIQRLLGHEGIRTTEVYLAVEPVALAKVLFRAHPRERWAEEETRRKRS